MLRVVEAKSFSDKEALLSDFDPKKSTWLVGDLRTKSEIQKRLLEKHGFLEEDSVLRASELWGKWSFRMAPEFRVVSSDYILSLLDQWLKDHEFDFARAPGAAATLLTYIGQLLPVLAAPEMSERMNEWFASQEKSFLRWRHWYELSRVAWTEMANLKIMPSTWCSGLVMANWQGGPIWGRTLYTDLSGQVSVLEAELLKLYSQSQDVVVMEPSAGWIGRYEQTLLGYLLLKDQGMKGPDEPTPSYPVPAALENTFVERYPTTLSEIKSVVVKVRERLEAGTLPADVAIAAPDIELYWPVLSRYLEMEGIPCNKPQMQRLSAFSSVESWFSKLRLKVSKLSSVDLERAYFDSSDHKKMSYEKFKRLFSLIYDDDDIRRSQTLAKVYQKEDGLGGQLTFQQFLAFCIGWWPDKSRVEELATVIKRVLADVNDQQVLSAETWLAYFERVVAKDEILLVEADPSGVQILNLEEAEWVNAPYLFALGFDESALSEYVEAGLTFADIRSLSESLGFFLDRTDHKKKELQSIWVLNQNRKETYLSFSATDFSGTPKAPNVYWLVLAHAKERDIEEFSPTLETRWDQLQQTDIETLACERGLSEDRLSLLVDQLSRDFGEMEPESFGGNLPWSLSASQLESYAKCPFLFAASKIFGLSDLPDVDLDIDRMTKGQFIHQMFCDLSEEPMRFDWTETEIKQVIDTLPEKTNSPIADLQVWEQQKSGFLNLAKRFLQHEKDLREQFPSLRVAARELPVELEWSQGKKGFVEPGNEGILFRGFLDRIDVSSTSGKSVVIDYKSSDQTQTNFRSWIKNGSYQLALYTLAMDSGLVEGEHGEVIAAFYYSAKTMAREKGFRLAEEVGELFDENKRNRSQLSREEKRELLEEIKEEIFTMVERMQAGEFFAAPKELKTCDSCDWRKQCRAPHLN